MCVLSTLLATALLTLLASAPELPAATPDFHADVAPILRDYCAGCHNEDDYEGDFSVETFKAIMEGGESGAAIAPGQAAESLLIQSVTKQVKPRMPPKKEPQPAPEEVAILRAWIEGGAKGPARGADESILATLHVPDIAAAPGLAKPITAAEYSPDGKRLAVARYRSVEVLHAKTRVAILKLDGHPGKINAVHFSADGKKIVTASGTAGLRGVAALWDARSGEKIREFGSGHRDILYDAEFSPDGKLLATAGYDRRITFWETATGDAVRRIDVHNGAIFDLAFSPDGKILASASGDETVKLWKVATGERLDTLNQPQDEQYSVVFTPDGKFVLAAGADNRIRMWRLVSRDRPKINPLIHARFAHEQEIVRLALTPDGRALVSASADRTLKHWTVPALKQVHAAANQSDLVAALAVRPDGKAYAAGRMDGTLQSYAFKKAGMAGSGGRPTQAADKGPVQEMSAAKPAAITESEPNDSFKTAAAIDLPAEIGGTIGRDGDADYYRFEAKAGEEWVLEVDAARNKSPLDSRIEVLDAWGAPVERVVLEAVRDSWFTFRGKNSQVSNDFRLHNWREMDLNEYLYANGEVVKLWHYPRGPDSGFNVYPGFGNRHTYFGTTAQAHPVGEPIYIVRPLPAGAQPTPSGLPVFRLYYENDDDPQRRWGNDSYLLFKVPEDGEYFSRIADVRGFGGEEFAYKLTVRPRRPDFKLTVKGMNPAVSPGSGKEFTLNAERIDGFDGEIRVDVSGLPDGFTASTPIVIEPGQFMATGVIYAEADAVAPTGKAAKAAVLTATATIGGREVKREAGGLGEIKIGKPAKVLVEILADGDSGVEGAKPGAPLEFTIAPGETITARVKTTRVDFENRIEFGKEDSGRNLPHGVYVDNIGLNGLLVVEGQTERQFFLTAADLVPETTRFFHLRTAADGGQASRPALLRVVEKK